CDHRPLMNAMHEEQESQMNEPLFGSAAPMWTAAPSTGIGYQVPLGSGSPALFGGSTGGAGGGVGVVNGVGGTTAGTPSVPPPVTPGYSYGPGLGQTLAPPD